MGEEESGKRSRAAKACDYCRKKKIRCDGSTPCANCSNSSAECAYTYVSKPRVPKKTKQSKKTGPKSPRNLKDLEKRLVKMESMIEALMMRTDDRPRKKNKRGSESDQTLLSSKEDSTETEEHSSDEFDEDMSADETTTEHAKEPFKDRIDAVMAAIPAPPGTQSVPLAKEHCKDQYVARHSSFSLFSETGLKWVSSRLKDGTTMYPLYVLIKKTRKVEQQALSLFIEPIDKERLTPLPPKKLTDFLVSYIFQNASGSNFFTFDMDLVKDVFDRLDKFRTGKISYPHFSYAELFMMNIVTTVAMGFQHELMITNNAKLKEWPAELRVEDIAKYENDYLTNSLYYFQRVSLVNDGLLGIQCILLLAVYADFGLLSKTASTILSVAVKQVQEAGLHRAETLMGLSEKERDQRIRIFWWCYTLDRDICLKFGSPLLIRDIDVSCPGQKAYAKYWTFNYPPSLEYLKGGTNRRLTMRTEIRNMLTKSMTEDKSWCFIEDFILHDISLITGKVYEQLYAGSVLIGKTSDEIYATIRSLLEDVENWRMLIPEEIRPGQAHLLYNFPITPEAEECKVLRLLLIHFRYYSLKTLITRVAFNQDWLGNVDEASERSKFATLCIESSRIILTLSDIIDTKFAGFSNCILFYPFTAFLCIFGNCIQNAGADYVIADVEQMIMAAKGFFVFDGERKARSKWGMLEIIVRNLLFIAITAVEDARGQTGLFDVGDYLDEVRAIAEDERRRVAKQRIPSTTSKDVRVSNIDYAKFEGPLAGTLDTNPLYRPKPARHFPVPSMEHIMTATGPLDTDALAQDAVYNGINAQQLRSGVTTPFGVNSNSPITGSDTNCSEFSIKDIIPNDISYTFSNLFNLPEYFVDFDENSGVFTPTDANDDLSGGMPNDNAAPFVTF